MQLPVIIAWPLKWSLLCIDLESSVPFSQQLTISSHHQADETNPQSHTPFHKMYSDIPGTPRHSPYRLPSWFPNLDYVYISHLSHANCRSHQYHPLLFGYRNNILWVPQTMKFPLGSFLHLSAICFLPPSAVASQTASQTSASLTAWDQVPHPYKTYNFLFQIQIFKF